MHAKGSAQASLTANASVYEHKKLFRCRNEINQAFLLQQVNRDKSHSECEIRTERLKCAMLKSSIVQILAACRVYAMLLPIVVCNPATGESICLFIGLKSCAMSRVRSMTP